VRGEYGIGRGEKGKERKERETTGGDGKGEA